MICPNCMSRFNYPAHRTIYYEQQGSRIKRTEISFCSPKCGREWIKSQEVSDDEK